MKISSAKMFLGLVGLNVSLIGMWNVPCITPEAPTLNAVEELEKRYESSQITPEALNRQDANGETLFSLALWMGKNKKFVMWMVEKGGDVARIYPRSGFPIMYSIRYGDPELTRFFIEKGAKLAHADKRFPDVLQALTFDFATHLQSQICMPGQKCFDEMSDGYTKCAKLLIQNGLGKKTSSNCPLTRAMRLGVLPLVHLLLENGYNINEPYYNRTPYEYAQVLLEAQKEKSDTDPNILERRKQCARLVKKWHE